MTNDQKEDFINLCNNNLIDIKNYIKKTLLGENGKENNHWCIMKTDKNFKTSFFDINVKFSQIKKVGLPIHKKLEFAVKERDKLNKDIRRMKKLLRL